MGDGTKDNPYTREDVVELIKANGSKAWRLDLSEKYFEKGTNFSGLDLRGIILGKISQGGIEITDFLTNFRSFEFKAANTEEASFIESNLESAKLSGVNLKGANLTGAHMHGAYMFGADFSENTNLTSIDWGKDFILGEEKESDEKQSDGRKKNLLPEAGDTYRRLKQWYTNAGLYGEAGQFYYREMEARRKGLGRKRSFWSWYLYFLNILCGYGEKWERTIMSAVVIILGLAFLYFITDALAPTTFLNSLYYSAISFTALGYGNWAPTPTGWAKGMGVAEAFIGVFMMALFLVIFTRKMTR